MPVVDYEPPTQDVPRTVRAGSHRTRRCAVAAPRTAAALHRAAQPSAGAGPGAVMSAPMRQAAVFADAALRRVLEVIDRRRPAAQLRPAAGAEPGRLGAVGRPSAAQPATAPRCCAACGCNRPVTATRTPRPRCSAPTAAGTGCTPSPAGSSRSRCGRNRWHGGRPAHRLTAAARSVRRCGARHPRGAGVAGEHRPHDRHDENIRRRQRRDARASTCRPSR